MLAGGVFQHEEYFFMQSFASAHALGILVDLWQQYMKYSAAGFCYNPSGKVHLCGVVAYFKVMTLLAC